MKKDDEIVRLATRLDPVGDDAFEGFAESSEGRSVLEAILREGGRRAPVAGRRRRVGVALAAAVAVAAGVVVLRPADPPERAPEARWAAALVEVAEEAPRLLVGADGWEVVDAIEFGGRQGEMTFDNGRSCMDADAAPGCYWVSLNWYPRESYEEYLADRRRGSERSWETTIDGHDASVFRAATPPMTFYALWVDGDQWIELRSDVIPTVEEFLGVAHTVRSVDVDAWLSAMPESVVAPDERPAVVDRLLAELPVPSNLDVETLKDRAVVANDHDLEYEVTRAVVCGWIAQWVDARTSSNEEARREAVEALATAHDWEVFREGGMFAVYVFDVADAMAEGEPAMGYPELPLGVGYRRQVGCHEG